MKTTSYVDAVHVETVAREKWLHDPQLRTEFLGDFECYVAYEKAAAHGLVKNRGQQESCQ